MIREAQKKSRRTKTSARLTEQGLLLKLKGRIYEGQFAGTLCFVPETCLKDELPDQIAYLRSGWASRNARLNEGKRVGSHLFPKGCAIHESAGLRGFVKKLAIEMS